MRDRSIRSTLEKLRVRLPTVNAIAIKTNSGHQWLGATNKNTAANDLEINGVGDVKRWVDNCAALRLDCIAWCVVRGHAPDQEAKRIAEVCAVPGLSAMILDVEVGDLYFRGDREDVRRLARTIRELVDDKYIGLCFDARGQFPQKIHIEEWLPYITGLHPMVYPESFRRDPVLAVKDAFSVLSKYEAYLHLPVTVWVRAHSLQNPDSLLRAVPTIFDRNRRAEGLVLWRYGDDVMHDNEFRAVRQLTIPEHVTSPRPTRLYVTSARIKLRALLRQVAYRTRLINVVRWLRMLVH